MLGATSPRTRPIWSCSSSLGIRSSRWGKRRGRSREAGSSHSCWQCDSRTLPWKTATEASGDEERRKVVGESVKVRKHLKCLDNNKDVVHADGQHQEGDDFDHDEGEGDAHEAKDPQRGRDGAQNNEDSSDSQGDLRVHLHRSREHRSPFPS